jgi:glutathione S-transferase
MMTLKLYYHPLSSFCHKVLVALYENATPFEPVMVDFFNEESAAQFKALWPIGKIPVLRDEKRDRTVPETSIIIEYLAQHYPGRVNLVSSDADMARQIRLRDRFYDLYVNVPMQKVVTDRLRPEGKSDSFGVEEAKNVLRTAYDMIDKDMADREWAMGKDFTMADCAATGSLFYANSQVPFRDTHKHVASYLDRLLARPSYARVMKEAEPYFHMVPK